MNRDMATILSIIDDYSERSFEKCTVALYEILSFYIMEKQDIRKVDLKEKIATYFATYKAIKPDVNCIDRIVELYGGIVSANIQFGKDRDKKYYLSAIESVKHGEDEETDLAALETLAMVYLSQMRELSKQTNQEKNKKKTVIGNTNYYISEEDLQVIKFIEKNVDQYSKNNIIVRKEIVTPKKMDLYDKKFVYIWSILLLYRILELEGEI